MSDFIKGLNSVEADLEKIEALKIESELAYGSTCPRCLKIYSICTSSTTGCCTLSWEIAKKAQRNVGVVCLIRSKQVKIIVTDDSTYAIKEIKITTP